MDLQLLPVVSPDNPVRVEHGNELEHEHAAQHVGAGIISSQDEAEEAVKNKRGRRFPGMHTAAEKENLQTNIEEKLLSLVR